MVADTNPVVQYWIAPDKFPIAAWITIFIAIIIAINFCGVRVFGEVEFWMSLFKVITLTGLIIFGIVIDLGGGPSHDRIGKFRDTTWLSQTLTAHPATKQKASGIGSTPSRIIF